MLPGATRSRAAILCFGGWGLQTMLHLAPRLQAAQEQRIATGVDGPDLTRITRFAALLPADQLNQQDELALNLFTLRDNRLPPFYLERLLHDLERSKTPAANESPSSQWRQATSQQRASLLLEAAGNTLLPLQWRESPDQWPGIGAATATPADNRTSARKGLPWPFRRSSKTADSGESPRPCKRLTRIVNPARPAHAAARFPRGAARRRQHCPPVRLQYHRPDPRRHPCSRRPLCADDPLCDRAALPNR